MEEKVTAQGMYWYRLNIFKKSILYYNDLLGKCKKRDRFISIFLAITSSTAIAGWAVWKELVIVWSIIIAASQVLTVVNQFLPYKKLIDILPVLTTKWSSVYYDMEEEWFKVARGDLSEQKIIKNQYDYIQKMAEIEEEVKATGYLPPIPAILPDYLEEELNEYMKRFLIEASSADKEPKEAVKSKILLDVKDIKPIKIDAVSLTDMKRVAVMPITREPRGDV